MSVATESLAALPKVVVRPGKVQPLLYRHPWLFAGAVDRIDGDPAPGAEVAVTTPQGEFLARGLFNPHSKIRVRLYSWDAEPPLDEAFWSQRLDAAIALRQRLFPQADAETAYRVVFSEADGLSGLVVDRYGDWLLVQLTSRALAERRDLLVRLLQEKLRPAGIWLRTEKGIRESEGLELRDGLIAGREPPRPMFLSEHGVRYGVDVVEGQKTGFFLDQRDNRAAAARYVGGHRVLDLFCYAGAFGLSAVKLGGAGEVLGVDTSEAALALARANAELNGVADRMRFEKAKVFDALEQLRTAGERFDTVIVDPPKMTRHRAGLDQALRGYHSLNQMALDVLTPGGMLVTCSCSGLVSRLDFEEMLASVAARTGRNIQILEARAAAPDHPTSVHCFETDYLKCYICRVV